MSKNNNITNLFFISSLQKYIIASTLLGLTIVLELTYDHLGIGKMSGNIGSLFKIALFPLILIGFLLGLKYSLIFSLLYACFHLLKACLFGGLFVYIEHLGFDKLQILSILLLDYFLVDMFYSLSGLLYLPNFLYFANFKKIWTNLLMIFSLVFLVKLLSSRFIWFEIVKNNNKYDYLKSLLDYPNIWCLFYNIIPVLNNFVIIGFLFCFLNPRIKTYLQNNNNTDQLHF